jgi:thymidylate synthase
MLIVEATTFVQAQTEILRHLLTDRACLSEDPELAAEAPALIRIKDPAKCAVPWRTNASQLQKKTLAHLPMAKELTDKMVEHYSKRISLLEIERVIDLIRRKPCSKRAVLSVWEPDDIARESGSACINYFWFRQSNDLLGCRVHMRACDVYAKLAADIAISCDLQMSVASALGLTPSPFELFTDCAHIYKKDVRQILKFIDEA